MLASKKMLLETSAPSHLSWPGRSGRLLNSFDKNMGLGVEVGPAIGRVRKNSFVGEGLGNVF